MRVTDEMVEAAIREWALHTGVEAVPFQMRPTLEAALAAAPQAAEPSEALREAARMALDFCEFCWRDVALNEFAEERRAGVEHRLREALGETK